MNESVVPKKIHYCWFGGNPLPPFAIKCIESWKKYLPDYEIIEWNESNYDVNKIPYISQAYKEKKYAFVSDYARFDILYEYGGIYFDTDVEVIKDLTEIISKGNFFGMEASGAIASGLGIGSKKGEIVIKEIIDSYLTSSFIKEDGTLNLYTVVDRVSDIFRKHGFLNENRIQTIANFLIYPKEYFCPKDVDTGILTITNNTYTIHHYDASWIEPWQKEVQDFKYKYMENHKTSKFSRFIVLFYHCKKAIENLGFKKGLKYIINKIKGNK